MLKRKISRRCFLATTAASSRSGAWFERWLGCPFSTRIMTADQT